MSFDIYGNNLTRGHCEVHPHVGEEYPCSVCQMDSQHRHVAQASQHEDWRLQDENEKLEARVKELEQAQNQLLSLIYNTAVGNVAMGYPVDIESLASDAYEITGINAEQVKTQQPEVK